MSEQRHEKFRGKAPAVQGDAVAYHGRIMDFGDYQLFYPSDGSEGIELHDFFAADDLIGLYVWLVRIERDDGWSMIDGVYPAE